MNDSVNAAFKILEVVKELHNRGYELIRICPSFATFVWSWRCFVSTKDNFDKKYGIMFESKELEKAFCYSSAALYEYFKGYNGKAATIKELADELLKRYPEFETKGKGQDSEYVKWYDKLFRYAKKGHFPYVMDDYYDCIQEDYIKCLRGRKKN